MSDQPVPTTPEGNMGSAVAAYNEKMKKAKKVGIPTEMAPRWEMLVDEATKGINKKRKEILKFIGEKPYKGIPIEKDEAASRYMQMRENAELQTETLKQNTITNKEGKLLINKAYLNAIIELEKQIREGG